MFYMFSFWMSLFVHPISLNGSSLSYFIFHITLSFLLYSPPYFYLTLTLFVNTHTETQMGSSFPDGESTSHGINHSENQRTLNGTVGTITL